MLYSIRASGARQEQVRAEQQRLSVREEPRASNRSSATCHALVPRCLPADEHDHAGAAGSRARQGASVRPASSCMRRKAQGRRLHAPTHDHAGELDCVLDPGIRLRSMELSAGIDGGHEISGDGLARLGRVKIERSLAWPRRMRTPLGRLGYGLASLAMATSGTRTVDTHVSDWDVDWVPAVLLALCTPPGTHRHCASLAASSGTILDMAHKSGM